MKIISAKGMTKLVKSACYNNSYKNFLPWVNSIGFCPPTLRYNHRRWMPQIAEDFLISTYQTRHDSEHESAIQLYLEDAGQTMLSCIGMRDTRELPKKKLSKSLPLVMQLEQVLLRRRSERQYTGDIISDEHVSAVLQAANGVTAESAANLACGEQVRFKLRAAPSGGGIYPIDIYLVSLRIKNIAKGIYQYSSIENSLFLKADETKINKLMSMFSVPEELISFSRANYFLIFVGHPWKTMRKYGNRGIRFLFHEIGCISQNIHLANTSLGLGSVDCASFYEDEVNQLLQFDGVNQSALHMIVTGAVS